jgi:hypothetical protein
MPYLSQYYTLHVIVRGLRIWPPNAAKYYKNAGKFFPNVRLITYCIYIATLGSSIEFYHFYY